MPGMAARWVREPSVDMMVHMSTANHPNNARLRELIESAGLTQAAALTLFNRGQVRPISLSGWKAWLAEPSAERWRVLSDTYKEHAEKVFAKVSKRL
jgi:hypothetical protein